jgi:hypothetical protein
LDFLVAQILALRGEPKIAEPIVRAVSVDVVDACLRIFASHVSPCDPV